MRTNPYPDEPTEVLPPRARMEELQPRVVQSPPPASEPAPEVESAETTRKEEAATVRYAIGKLNDFMQWFMAVLEVTLGIRFFFKLIGAASQNPFAGFLYSLTDIVLFPFNGIVSSYNNRVEWQTLIAMIIYWLIFWGIRRFLHILITPSSEETAS